MEPSEFSCLHSQPVDMSRFGYTALPESHAASDKSKVVGAVALACVALGATVGFVASSSVSSAATELFAPVATRPAVRPATVVAPRNQLVNRMGQEQFVMAAAPEEVYEETIVQPQLVQSQAPVAAILGGLGIAGLLPWLC